MYNVKILKYPTGWQYRIYSRPVGYCDNDKIDLNNFDDEIFVWNPDIQDYEQKRCDLSQCWVNPFTDEMETTLPKITYMASKEVSAKNSMNRTINRLYHLARSNSWDWFITLTFDPQKVNSFDYGECTKKLSKWLNNLKRFAPGIKYIIVPEKHKSGRFHFHGLLANCEGLDFTDSGKVTDRGQPIYNIGRYKLGFSTATKVIDGERVTKYISKYITKELCSVSSGKKRYWCNRNLEECETEELLLEDAEQQLQHIMEQAKYVKKIENSEITTIYVEMGCNNE